MTWLELAFRNAGFRKGQTALVWALMWAVTRESKGSDPTVDEVAAWWKENERTAYREQAAFRAAFPTLETPAKIFEVPEVRARIAKLAKEGDDMEARKKARRRIPESLILDLGLGHPTS
jgi:aminopeptidase N